MTLHAPLWEENDDYVAGLDRQFIDVVFATGGIVASTDLVVTQRGSGANMSVDVAAGRVVVPGTDISNQGKYICWADAVTNVTIATAPGTGNSRIDLIIARVRDADAAGGSNNDWVLTAVTGTAASSPSVPSAPASSVVLARVAVGANVTSITTSNVTDERLAARVHGTEPGVGGDTYASTAPFGALLCNGAAVSRTLYSALFAKIGTNWGVGDGTTTFNVPDMRDLVAVGAGSSYSLASTGGEANHTLDIGEMPSHGHTVGGSNSNEVLNTSGIGSGTAFGVGATNVYFDPIDSEGGGGSHNNLQPYAAVNKFIWY